MKQKARKEKRIPTSEEVYKEIKKQGEAKRKEAIIEEIQSLDPLAGEHEVTVIDPLWPYASRFSNVTHQARNP
jgi:hypothetical protein